MRSSLVENHNPTAHEHKRATNHKTVAIMSSIALVIVCGLLFLSLFSPSLPYTVKQTPTGIDSPHFFNILAALTGARVQNYEEAQVFTNGENYYPAEIAAIRAAQHNINIEAYIFNNGDIAQNVIEALTERSRSGIKVRMIVDSIGSTSPDDDLYKPLKDAGGRVVAYNRLKWYTWPRMNSRTHREMTIIDGKVGFIGGAGYADHWYEQVKDDPRWRDTMVRVTGAVVTGMQGTFAENWLESSGEVLTAPDLFPLANGGPGRPGMVVQSTPTSGGSTEARLLIQMLMASAKSKMLITTPYFLPDLSIRDEILNAIKQRHVDVRILVPGKRSDHALTRGSSRRLYGDLLKGGAHIYEYQPAMIHAKVLVVDGLWSVVGSTNLDSRSFNINDEVNFAAPDPQLAQRLEQDFWTDLKQSHEINYEEWKHRPMIERLSESLGSLIQRQQ